MAVSGADSRDDRVNEAIAHILAAEEQGQVLDPDELTARYPDIADDLASFFANRDGFRRFADASGVAGPAPRTDGSTVTRSPPESANTQTWPGSATSTDFLGQVPDGYEVIGELGRGGMGVVYHVRDRALHREVALKMVLAGRHASADELARFLGEARAAAALQHPNVIQVYSVDAFDGLPYFTLEYCPGGSLADRFDGTPQPPAESARLIGTIARAVQFAHHKGIVHRDLKPANILLAGEQRAADSTITSRLGSDNGKLTIVPKITDFGLAKRFQSGTGLTAS